MLQQLSKTIRDKKVEVPSAMAYIFRVMTESRGQLGKFFKRSAGVESNLHQNFSHEYFTSRYQILVLVDLLSQLKTLTQL